MDVEAQIAASIAFGKQDRARREIPFTQYVMPDGRRRETSIVVAPDVADMAGQIIEGGHRFECEVLSTGQVSLTIFNTEECDDVAIEVLPNGPGIREAVEKMVREYAALAARQNGGSQ